MKKIASLAALAYFSMALSANAAVIDFTGNPITIQFTIGGVNNVLRNNNLKALKYKLRK